MGRRRLEKVGTVSWIMSLIERRGWSVPSLIANSRCRLEAGTGDSHQEAYSEVRPCQLQDRSAETAPVAGSSLAFERAILDEAILP